MKEYIVDPNEIFYFKPRDIWCIPRHLFPEEYSHSFKVREEVFINKEKYHVVGSAAFYKNSGPLNVDILFKKVLEN